MLLVTQNLKLNSFRANRPIFVCGHVVIDVFDVDELAQDRTSRHHFRLTSDYQISIETDGQWWGCTHPQLEEDFFRPIEDGIVGQAAGKDIFRAATLHYAETLDGAASLLSPAPGRTPLIGFEWSFSMPLERLEAPAAATQDADLRWPEPSVIEAKAKVIAVEPTSLVTVGDALQLMRDIVKEKRKHRQNLAQLADESSHRVVRPNRRLPLHG